jgi:anti-sigma factor RsiW
MSVSERELHAYVDDEVTPDRRSEIADWLATHPEAAARVAAWRAQNEAIRRIYPAVSLFRPTAASAPRPLPVEAAPILASARSARQDGRRASLKTGVFLLAAISIALVAFLFRDMVAPLSRAPATQYVSVDGLPGAAATAFAIFAEDSARPVESEGAAIASYLLPRTGVGAAPQISGAQLMGARVIQGGAQAAALFVYQLPAGERLGLVIEKTGARQAPATYERSGVRVVTRRANGFDHALAGRLPQATLDGLLAALSAP